jgi:hypothetical protein
MWVHTQKTPACLERELIKNEIICCFYYSKFWVGVNVFIKQFFLRLPPLPQGSLLPMFVTITDFTGSSSVKNGFTPCSIVVITKEKPIEKTNIFLVNIFDSHCENIHLLI